MSCKRPPLNLKVHVGANPDGTLTLNLNRNGDKFRHTFQDDEALKQGFNVCLNEILKQARE